MSEAKMAVPFVNYPWSYLQSCSQRYGLGNLGLGAALGAFLGGVALRADLALAGATLARRGATRAFLLGSAHVR